MFLFNTYFGINVQYVSMFVCLLDCMYAYVRSIIEFKCENCSIFRDVQSSIFCYKGNVRIRLIKRYSLKGFVDCVNKIKGVRIYL